MMREMRTRRSAETKMEKKRIGKKITAMKMEMKMEITIARKKETVPAEK